MRPLSFFKLPLIFISVYAAISIGWILIGFIPLILHNQYNEMIPYIITSQLLDRMFFLLLVFIIAIFQCNKYRLHAINSQNLLKIAVIVTVFIVLSIVWMRSSYLVLQPAYAYLKELNLSLLTAYFFMMVTSVIYTIVLMFLFGVIAGGDVANREPYVFDDFSSKHIHAAIFSLILLMLSTLPLSASPFNLIIVIDTLSRLSLTTSIAYFILFIVILVMVFNYWFVYASTRSCFKSLPTSLQVIPLIKSIAITLLFVTVFSILVGLISDAFMLLAYVASHSKFLTCILYIMTFCLIYLGLYISTQVAVRIIFRKKTP